MTVLVRRVEQGRPGGGAGFRVGGGSELNEYRSNTFARGGIIAGFSDGQLKLGPATFEFSAETSAQIWDQPLRLTLRGVPANAPNQDAPNAPADNPDDNSNQNADNDNSSVNATDNAVADRAQDETNEEAREEPSNKVDGEVVLTLVAESLDGTELGRVGRRFPANALLGNVSLVNNYTAPGPRGQANQANQDRYLFRRSDLRKPRRIWSDTWTGRAGDPQLFATARLFASLVQRLARPPFEGALQSDRLCRSRHPSRKF